MAKANRKARGQLSEKQLKKLAKKKQLPEPAGIPFFKVGEDDDQENN